VHTFDKADKYGGLESNGRQQIAVQVHQDKQTIPHSMSNLSPSCDPSVKSGYVHDFSYIQFFPSNKSSAKQLTPGNMIRTKNDLKFLTSSSCPTSTKIPEVTSVYRKNLVKHETVTSAECGSVEKNINDDAQLVCPSVYPSRSPSNYVIHLNKTNINS